MKDHREPRPSVIVERYKFNSRQRLPSESISEYVAALRKLAEFCNYGESLDEMLCDRFVCGIAHSAVQKRFLTEANLSFTKAVTVAQVVELAEKGSQQIQSPGDTEPKEVHKFSTTKQNANKNKDNSKDKSTCYRCGGKHNQLTCRFKSETCRFCSKRGHIAKVCRKRLSSQDKPTDTGKATHQVTQDSCDTVPSEYNLFTLPSQQAKLLQATKDTHSQWKWILEQRSPLLVIKLGATHLTCKISHFNLAQPNSAPTQERLFQFWES